MNPEQIRNIGIAAHIDAGKTTVAERILVETGIERHMGRVEDGTTVLDFLAPERDRGITIVSACTHVPWGGCGINLIDTPGHVDFTLEVQRCMHVLDGGVLVLDAGAGVQAQTETVWRQMKRQGVATLALINKCDLPEVDPLGAVASLEERLDAHTLLIQYPQTGPKGLTGLVDLVERRYRTWSGGKGTLVPLPESLSDEVEVLRSELADKISNLDDEFLEHCLSVEESPSGQADPQAMHAAIRRVTRAGLALPVMFGSGLSGMGIDWLLDGICAYLPSPADRLAWGSRVGGALRLPAPDADAPLSCMLFKFQDQGKEELAFLRIYGGTIRPGDELWNPRTQEHERVLTLARVHAEHGEELASAGPGQIVGVTGIKASATGDTLCDPAHPLQLEAEPPPAPVIQRILEPQQDADRPALAQSLARLVHQDSSLYAHEGPSPGQWTLGGVGELHLEILAGRLAQLSGVEPRVGKPRVTYLETIEGVSTGTGKIERTLAGEVKFGMVSLAIRPQPRAWSETRTLSSGLEVTLQPEISMPNPGQGAKSSSTGAVAPNLQPQIEFGPTCSIPDPMRSGIEAALLGEAQSGPLCGFPLAGIMVTVVGGETRPGQDSQAAFAQAAIVALRDALGGDGTQVSVLEPTMSFEVEVREEFASAVMADLTGRGAQIEGFRPEGTLRVIWGMVTLYSMLGYATGVRSISQGNATYSLRPRGQRALTPGDLESRGLSFG